MNPIILPILIVIVAVAVQVWLLRAWRRDCRELAPREYDFRWRQFRRRTQINILCELMVIGLMIVWQYFLVFGPPIATFFVLGIILLAIWAIVLAMVDMWATREYFSRARHELFLQQQTELNAQLQRLREKKSSQKD